MKNIKLIILSLSFLFPSIAFSCPNLDVNGDGRLSSIDALLVINALNSESAARSPNHDVNCDGRVSAIDALLIINALNSGSNGNSGNTNSSGTNTPPNSNLPPQQNNNNVPDIYLDIENNDLDVNFISIDEFKTFDRNLQITGPGVIRRSDATNITVSDNGEGNDPAAATFSMRESNLQSTWGGTRVSNHERLLTPNGNRPARYGSYNASLSNMDYSISNEPPNNRIEGSYSFANGVSSASKNELVYESPNASSDLDFSTSKEIFIRLFNDHFIPMSGFTPEFEIILKDRSGATHSLKYVATTPTEPYAVAVRAGSLHGPGLKLLRAKIDAFRSRIDVSKISGFTLKILAGPAQDGLIDYIRVDNPSNIFSPEDYGSASISGNRQNSSCKYAKLTYKSMYDQGLNDWMSIWGQNNLDMFSSDISQTSPCMKAKIEEAMNLCGSDGKLKINTYNYYDNNSAYKSRNHTDAQLDLLRTWTDQLSLSQGNNDDCVTMLLTNQGIHYINQIRNNGITQNLDYSNNQLNLVRHQGVSSFTRYFDENCRALTDAEVQNITNNHPNEICPDLAFRHLVTPISLKWDNHDEHKESISVVSFPLDKEEGKFYTWRASETMPLLVHDPLKTGKITSASQLFGGWAFGGKGQSASLMSSLFKAEKWENGYEALSSLDLNRDSEISGNELKDLSLWFDKNQNGISEEGEVVSLDKANVTKLFYGPTKVEDDGKSISLSVGYERIIDSKKVTGATVDWFSDSYDSATEAVVSFEAKRALRTSDETIKQDNSLTSNTTKPNPADPINGVWEWTADEVKFDNKRKVPVGGLIYINKKDQGFTGVSVNEVPVQISSNNKNIAKIKSISNEIKFEGSDVPGEVKGSRNLSFTINSKGVVTQTDAIFSEDAFSGSHILKGKSTTTHKDSKTEKEINITYNWTAKKLIKK